MTSMAPEQSHQEYLFLIIEDDGYCSYFLAEILKMEGIRTVSAKKDSKAFEMVLEHEFTAVILVLESRSAKELTLIELLREINDQLPIIVVSERTDVDYALSVLRAGAFDYLSKPFDNLSRVETALNNAISEYEKLRQTNDLDEGPLSYEGLMGKSKAFTDLHAIIKQIAPLEVNVMITGESGTGKELFARFIHSQSNRKSGPFVVVNCGALPEGLVESLLFGHEKGAFTGAIAAHVGYIENAHGGTLFLDEVGELLPKTQVALLRFIQEQDFIRVGGTEEMKADVRLIAATNRNLEEDVNEKRFRDDLYYRLNVVHLKTPPLRSRGEDIMHLATHFAKRFCLRNKLPLRTFSTQAAGVLENYSWPGNVRELENMMESLMATLPVRKHTVTPSDLLDFSEKLGRDRDRTTRLPTDAYAGQTYKNAMYAFEESYLRELLAQHQNNVARAAKAAGIHAVTLHRKLRKLREMKED